VPLLRSSLNPKGSTCPSRTRTGTRTRCCDPLDQRPPQTTDGARQVSGVIGHERAVAILTRHRTDSERHCRLDIARDTGGSSFDARAQGWRALPLGSCAASSGKMSLRSSRAPKGKRHDLAHAGLE
jgi:hypothetical protein